MNFNKVFIAGNLTKDPEMKYTNSGKAVATLNVAVNEYGSTEASFFRVIVWEKQAENAMKYISKGKPVFIEGRVKTRNYEHEGQKRTITEIIAQNVQYLHSPNEEKQNEQANSEEFNEQIEEGGDVPF
jgi:single-strand DNA-binding protein